MFSKLQRHRPYRYQDVAQHVWQKCEIYNFYNIILKIKNVYNNNNNNNNNNNINTNKNNFNTNHYNKNNNIINIHNSINNCHVFAASS